jgi:hypothetical protein
LFFSFILLLFCVGTPNGPVDVPLEDELAVDNLDGDLDLALLSSSELNWSFVIVS